MTHTPKVSIIVLNWNGLNDTIECLESIYKIDYPNYEIIVIDNASSDGSPKHIQSKFSEIILIKNKENLGFAEGNNVGIKYAMANMADYILILNNDTIVDPKILQHFIQASSAVPEAGIFGGQIYYYSDRNRICSARTKWNSRTYDFDLLDKDSEGVQGSLSGLLETDYVCGGALFVSREVIDKIGLFDPDFFLCWEETDFCYRARKRGVKCIIVTDAKIWHKVAASFNGWDSPLREYFNNRNRLLWAEKNLSFRLRWAVYVAVLKEFFPNISANRGSSLIKRMYWDLLRISSNYHNPGFTAKAIGIRDFFIGRFGKCPSRVLQLQKNWQERRT